ncbi:DUF948 domain-containing protein [Paenibacillus xerothermodurans]|uniref:DUF948 domain-containing protein n=1 Tax=Paenibacillus xerothermodurans TaxID=1977292 RepID=A0A2W1NAL4_PAEXE|nr:DUF948 domain-containing protein [Paenibacillus xerothermodurans]PZE20241.1 DUF948 domain-containing protein [Paenibacillus xerothermodurans]
MDGNLIIEISVAVIAVAFVVLVVFLIFTLRTMMALLSQSNTTIQDLRYEIKGISKEASEVLHHTNAVTADVLNKLHALEPTFDSVKQVGEAVEEITSSVKHASVTVARTIQEKVNADVPPKSNLATAIKSIPIIIDLWQQFKSRQVQAGAK